MTDKTLAEIYREAAEIVLKGGKVEGDMKKVRKGDCLGFCTMGAVFEAQGEIFDAKGRLPLTPDGVTFTNTNEFMRLAEPVARQIISSGRYVPDDDGFKDRNLHARVFWTIADWNDACGSNWEKVAPSAADVAELLRETADAVERATR